MVLIVARASLQMKFDISELDNDKIRFEVIVNCSCLLGSILALLNL